ncbi:MAG: hypothetical protein Ct9H300mP3_00520 [Gammaproteobacteria bacterium]|nr:MAG: hypothetical protein Ct9H300mP3_00520 [Gammaproteobacteria bacterium]
MAETSTKVFILEVMGRHPGWIAAASGLAREKTNGSSSHNSFSGNPLLIKRRGFLKLELPLRNKVIASLLYLKVFKTVKVIS